MEEEGYSRFHIGSDSYEVEIQRYLDYVKTMVGYLKDRVEYYELWNEPDNQGFPVQYIQVPDYIEMVKQVVPAIRQEYPGAKIVVGSSSGLMYSKNWLFGILTSDEIMPLVDVVSWHPFYGTSPAWPETRDFYYQYPSIVQAIKDTAYAHGFRGEYRVDEVSYWEYFHPDYPEVNYSIFETAKYLLRAIMLHLGLDIPTIIASKLPWYFSYGAVRNLCTVMEGNMPENIPVQIHCSDTTVRSFSYSLPDDNKMVALWTDGVAVDFDPGVPATIKLPGFTDKKVFGIDVLNGFEQELITEVENDSLVIRNLLVKDYPIILRIGSTSVGVKGKKLSDPGNCKIDNYPNPFNTATTIEFQVPERSDVSIKIYNLKGQEIRIIVNKKFEPGLHIIEWNGSDNKGNTVPAGIYLIRMKSDEYVKTTKCLLLK